MLRFEVKAGPTGSLFGSVTPTQIADELWRTRKVRVDRRKIEIDTIKRIGRYEVPIELFQDVRVDVNTIVVPEGGELPSDDELAAMEAEERGAEEAAAPAPAEGAGRAGGRSRGRGRATRAARSRRKQSREVEAEPAEPRPRPRFLRTESAEPEAAEQPEAPEEPA